MALKDYCNRTMCIDLTMRPAVVVSDSAIVLRVGTIAESDDKVPAEPH
ncbi:hypothetical protein SDC9_58087 [bioreactor metagenome]|uniref:Uncharacterized protein n=1 Tax=bioreactor metagenome TaxID=1076179 RepID=A0A644X6E0_9ZZZZ